METRSVLRGSAHAVTSDFLCPQLHSGSSEAEEENDPDGAYAFRRKAGCQYFSVSSLYFEKESARGCQRACYAPPTDLNAPCNFVRVRVCAGSSGPRGQLAVVSAVGGQLGGSPLPLQSHHAHCAATLPRYGPAPRRTRRQVSSLPSPGCVSLVEPRGVSELTPERFAPPAGCCWTGLSRTTTTSTTDWTQTYLTRRLLRLRQRLLRLRLLRLLQLPPQLLCARRPPTSLPVPQKQIPQTEAPCLAPPHPPRTSVRYC